jgi:hypothetical protein
MKSLLKKQEIYNVVISAKAGIHLRLRAYGFRVKPGMTIKYLFQKTPIVFYRCQLIKDNYKEASNNSKEVVDKYIITK